MRLPLNADCSVDLTHIRIIDGETLLVRSCRDESSVRVGLRFWTIRDLRGTYSKSRRSGNPATC
jgi:hypothetical protein